MLKNDSRRRLIEHGWLEIAKRHSNPSLALNRLKNQAVEAINDLALLAEKLPDEVKREIFTYGNVQKLVNSVLDVNPDADPADHARSVHLASNIVRIGIGTCLRWYVTAIEKDAVLNEPIRSHLHKSADICDQIAFKIRLPQIHLIEEKENLAYLFNVTKIKDIYQTRVSDIQGEDTQRFIEFCMEEFNCEFDIVQQIIQTSDNEIKFEFIDSPGECIRGELVRSDHNYALKRMVDGELILKRTLIAQREHYNYYVYREKRKT